MPTLFDALDTSVGDTGSDTEMAEAPPPGDARDVSQAVDSSADQGWTTVQRSKRRAPAPASPPPAKRVAGESRELPVDEDRPTYPEEYIPASEEEQARLVETYHATIDRIAGGMQGNPQSPANFAAAAGIEAEELNRQVAVEYQGLEDTLRGFRGSVPPVPSPPLVPQAEHQPVRAAQAKPQRRIKASLSPPAFPMEGAPAAHTKPASTALVVNFWPSDAPAPDGPDADNLTAGLHPEQRRAWFDYVTNGGHGCLAYVECAATTTLPPELVVARVEQADTVVHPGEQPIIASAANPYNGKRSGTLLIRGTKAQIQRYVAMRVVSSSIICFFIVPIPGLPSVFVVTLTNLRFSPDRLPELVQMYVAELKKSARVRNYIAAHNDNVPKVLAPGIDPVDYVLDTLALEPVHLIKPKHDCRVTWYNVEIEPPVRSSADRANWRQTVASVEIVTAMDGFSQLPDKPFHCTICDSLHHPQGLCNIASHPLWLGFRPSSRAVNQPAGDANAQSQPALAYAGDAAPPTNLVPSSSSKPAPKPGNFKGKAYGKSFKKK